MVVMLDELGEDASTVGSVDLVMMVLYGGGVASSRSTNHEVIRLHVMVNQMVVWVAHHV